MTILTFFSSHPESRIGAFVHNLGFAAGVMTFDIGISSRT